MSASPDTVLLGHGSGGQMMKRIIDEVFYDAFGNVIGHVTDTTNEDHCDDWGSGSGGGRYGPGKLH